MKAEHFQGDPLKADLLQAILRGDLKPGERLPPFRTLATRYKVSLNTVQRVVGTLVDDKVLETTQGRGTFVSTARRLSAATSFAVGLFVHTSGHFFGPLFDSLRETLAQHGAMPIVCDFSDEPLEYVRHTRLRELIDGKLRSFVVDGSIATNPALSNVFLAKRLQQWTDRIRDLTVINRWEHPQRVPGSYFLFDYQGAGMQIAQYLMGLGHRRIVLHTFGSPLAPGAYESDIHDGMIRFSNSCAHQGLRIEFCSQQHPLGLAEIASLFSASDRPTAVVAVTDYLARPWFDRLATLGLRVPQDVSIMGFYNTPHATEMPVPLTSVQLNTERLVLQVTHHIVAAHAATEPTREEQFIGASLVLRSSCAPAHR